ncbi:hypothetical protein BH11MYX3_BH11MYX3_07350 [soil metagenome]
MRAIAIALVLVAAGSVQADPYVELGAGLLVPMSDNDYTDAVDPSIDLAARIGGGDKVGGMASIEWAPLSSNVSFVSFYRFRLLGHVVLHHAVSRKVELVGRFGAGIDYLHASTEGTIAGIHFDDSDSDLGLALELAGGAWFDVGKTTQLGFELAIPIGYHSDDNRPSTADNVNWDFTTVDIEIFGGVRLHL